MKVASDKLRKHYVNELIRCIVDQPLSKTGGDTSEVMREDVYIDLVVLPSDIVDQEWSNSDRSALMQQQHSFKPKSYNSVDQIPLPEDELVFISGIGGIGKSTMVDMFTFKWAKGGLANLPNTNFLFKFTCRDLNNISGRFTNLKELFELKFPEVIKFISFEDLMEISDRVLVIVDGTDELKDLYLFENPSVSTETNLADLVFDLINPKGKWLPNHKVIASGRLKAIEFIKNKLPRNSKRKTVEVCGFDDENIRK